MMHPTGFLCAVAGVLSTVATTLPVQAGGPDLSGVELEHVASIDGTLTFVTHAPGDPERLFATRQIGEIWVVRGGQASLYVDLTSTVVPLGEGGLIGLAFDPAFSANGKLYVCYTAGELAGVRRWVVEMIQVDDVASDAPSVSGRATVLTQFDGAGSNHQGGWLGFGHDGFLRVALGDTGRRQTAQDLTDRRGSIMRIDPNADDFPADPAQNYGVPSDNPFVTTVGAASEMEAYGIRNPYRCSVDRETGDLWIANVGAVLPGEFHIIPQGASGQNFGWPCFEGGACINSGGCSTGPCADPSMLMPVASVPRESGRCALTGVEVYRGFAMPALDGVVLYADLCGGQLEAIDPTDGAITTGPDTGFVYSLGHDADGEVYVVNRSAIQRVVPADGGCPADWNGDAFANDQDFFDFINDYFSAQGARGHAEFNRDGFQNDQDFFDFINAFFNPAPACGN